MPTTKKPATKSGKTVAQVDLDLEDED